ncbi:MAG: TraR/DksA family transcriptional regulator [Acidimicrobiales bacterium]
MPSASYHELEAELAGVERALERLDEGTYGLCGVCGNAISEEVLASSPTATLCPEHDGAPKVPSTPSPG